MSCRPLVDRFFDGGSEFGEGRMISSVDRAAFDELPEPLDQFQIPINSGERRWHWASQRRSGATKRGTPAISCERRFWLAFGGPAPSWRGVSRRLRAPPTFAVYLWQILSGGGRETARPPAAKTPAPSTFAPLLT